MGGWVTQNDNVYVTRNHLRVYSVHCAEELRNEHCTVTALHISSSGYLVYSWIASGLISVTMPHCSR